MRVINEVICPAAVLMIAFLNPTQYIGLFRNQVVKVNGQFSSLVVCLMFYRIGWYYQWCSNIDFGLADELTLRA